MVLAKWETKCIWKRGTSENRSEERNRHVNIEKNRKIELSRHRTVGLILRNLSSKKGSDEDRSGKRKNNKIALIGRRTRNLAARNGFQ